MSDVRDDKRAFYKEGAKTSVRKVSKTVTFEGTAAKATGTTALTGNNNDLDFTARKAGADGNDVTIEYVAPTAASQALSVDVVDSAVTVNLASGAGTNEVQTVTVVATGGTFILGYKDQFTQPIPYNATTAVVQAKLRELPGLSEVTVGGSAGAWTVTYVGSLAGTDVDLLLIDGTRLRPYKPRVVVQTITQGDDDPATNEVQKVYLVNGSVGTFTLTYAGQTTAPIAYNASAATVDAALEALSNIGAGDVSVVKTGDYWTVTFGTALAATNVAQMTGNAAGLLVASVAAGTPGVAYAITTTAAQVTAALAADAEANNLIVAANKAGNDGTGVVTAMAATALTGGKDGNGGIPALAAYTTVLTGANNDMVFTSKRLGLLGNDITITYVDPGGATADLAVTVENETDIVVSLARAASAISSTAAQIKSAIEALPGAHALVTITNSGGDTGAGLVTAMAKQYLVGGVGLIELFEAVGDVRCTAVVSSVVVPTGTNGTIIIGTPDDTDSLIPSIVGTTLAAGRTADFGGLETVGTAPSTTPHQALNNGQKVTLTIGTTALATGQLDIDLYYTPVTEGARVRAL